MFSGEVLSLTFDFARTFRPSRSNKGSKRRISKEIEDCVWGERTDWQMGKLLVGVTHAQIFCSRKAPPRVISLGHFRCVPGSSEGDTEGAGLGWVGESFHFIRGAHLQFLQVCLPWTSRFDFSACRALPENIVLLRKR